MGTGIKDIKGRFFQDKKKPHQIALAGLGFIDGRSSAIHIPHRFADTALPSHYSEYAAKTPRNKHIHIIRIQKRVCVCAAWISLSLTRLSLLRIRLRKDIRRLLKGQ